MESKRIALWGLVVAIVLVVAYIFAGGLYIEQQMIPVSTTAQVEILDGDYTLSEPIRLTWSEGGTAYGFPDAYEDKTCFGYYDGDDDYVGYRYYDENVTYLLDRQITTVGAELGWGLFTVYEDYIAYMEYDWSATPELYSYLYDIDSDDYILVNYSNPTDDVFFEEPNVAVHGDRYIFIEYAHWDTYPYCNVTIYNITDGTYWHLAQYDVLADDDVPFGVRIDEDIAMWLVWDDSASEVLFCYYDFDTDTLVEYVDHTDSNMEVYWYGDCSGDYISLTYLNDSTWNNTIQLYDVTTGEFANVYEHSNYAVGDWISGEFLTYTDTEFSFGNISLHHVPSGENWTVDGNTSLEYDCYYSKLHMADDGNGYIVYNRDGSLDVWLVYLNSTLEQEVIPQQFETQNVYNLYNLYLSIILSLFAGCLVIYDDSQNNWLRRYV